MCWACGEELTDEFEAGQRELLATLNKTALAAYLRKHRDTHRQYLLLQPKLQLCEYSQRHLTLLHHLLNSVAATLGATCAAAATPALKAAMNQELERRDFWFRSLPPDSP